MVERFKRVRWHPARIKMDAMQPGDSLQFPKTDYEVLNQSKHRLNDAYMGERFYTVKKRRVETFVRVERIK